MSSIATAAGAGTMAVDAAVSNQTIGLAPQSHTELAAASKKIVDGYWKALSKSKTVLSRSIW